MTYEFVGGPLDGETRAEPPLAYALEYYVPMPHHPTAPMATVESPSAAQPVFRVAVYQRDGDDFFRYVGEEWR